MGFRRNGRIDIPSLGKGNQMETKVKEYQGLYNPDLFPSAHAVNRRMNTGKMFPGSFSHREKRILSAIIHELGFDCEIKPRPLGSMPYIVISYMKPGETELSEWWANDIESIERFINKIIPDEIGKFIDWCWERF